jgi:hypothetical protein
MRKHIPANAFRTRIQSPLRRMALVAIRHISPPVPHHHHEADSLADLPQWP